MIIIKNYIEVICKILPLLETIEEGFSYIQKLLSELRYEEALTVFQDIIEGIASIQNAIQPIQEQLLTNNIDGLFVTVNESISKTVRGYEKGREVNFECQIVGNMFPAFKNWKEEIENVLKSYVVS